MQVDTLKSRISSIMAQVATPRVLPGQAPTTQPPLQQLQPPATPAAWPQHSATAVTLSAAARAAPVGNGGGVHSSGGPPGALGVLQVCMQGVQGCARWVCLRVGRGACGQCRGRRAISGLVVGLSRIAGPVGTALLNFCMMCARCRLASGAHDKRACAKACTHTHTYTYTQIIPGKPTPHIVEGACACTPLVALPANLQLCS